MSKAFKKLMKQQEEEKLAQQLKELDIEKVKPVKQVKATNMFAAMGVNDTEFDEDYNDSNKQDNQQKITVECILVMEIDDTLAGRFSKELDKIKGS